jgi:hypothetical protein
MVPIGGAEPQFSDAASQSLVQVLRQGGYVVLVRQELDGPAITPISDRGRRVRSRSIMQRYQIDGPTPIRAWRMSQTGGCRRDLADATSTTRSAWRA